ncbi:MAG: hypothetical protein JO086_00055 [Acidimicrobiia bacterium]|nr:hypothetical protein [Acidimicrobiia bacterium]
MTFPEVHKAVGRSTTTEPYRPPGKKPMNGGTMWRIWGPGADGDRLIGIGFEAFCDGAEERVMLCTVITNPEEPS